MLHRTLQKLVSVLTIGALAVSCVPAVSDAAAYRPSVMRNEVLASSSELPADDNFNIIAEPFEWGMDVTRIMLKADASYSASDVKAEDFTVYGEHYSEQAYKNDSAGERKVVNAYPVDEQGNRADDGMYIVLELEYGKDVQAGHMGSYNYANYYTPLMPRNYKITWSRNGSTYTQNDKTNIVKLVIDEFKLERHIDNSVEDAQYNFVDYAFYTPKEDGKKKPLIIFFHGMGEGGARDLKNHGVQMYAYQEEAFAEKEIQDIMGGSAYVLLPQSPDTWPKGGYGFTEESPYLQVVKNLIDTVIAENKDIDTNRIYIGGLSMGGFMACRMIINFPEMFAAAFPCSQAYAITESDAEKLKNLPVWVSCSEVDGTCAMDPYTYASYVKLKEAGNQNARCAVVKSNRNDTTCRMEFYTPAGDEPELYEIKCDEGRENTKKGDLTFNNDTYGGHEAGWILLFNNREYYVDESGKEVTAMEWVASQSLVSTLKLDTSKVKTSYKTGEKFSAEGLAVTAVMRDGTTQNVTDYTVSAVDTSKAGDVKVTVSYSGKSEVFTVKVADEQRNHTTSSNTADTSQPPAATAAPAATINLSDTKVKLAKKGANKYKLTANVKNSTDAVVWTSSNTKVATVNSKGVVTAKTAGNAVIKATVSGVSSECKVIVKNITFKAAKNSITVKKGKSAKIKVKVTPKNKVSYKTSSKKIVIVNSKGVVKGVKKGPAAITVTCQGIKLTIKVKVK